MDAPTVIQPWITEPFVDLCRVGRTEKFHG